MGQRPFNSFTFRLMRQGKGKFLAGGNRRGREEWRARAASPALTAALLNSTSRGRMPIKRERLQPNRQWLLQNALRDQLCGYG